MKNHRIWLMLGVFVILSVATAYAGVVYRLSCSNRSLQLHAGCRFRAWFLFQAPNRILRSLRGIRWIQL